MIGIMSSVVPSRIQVDRLNEKLKQAMNLVKDLQEELEMKDQLMVKEIDWKASSGESSGRNRTPDEHSSYCDWHKSKLDMEKSEAMSKIEAELEAELERLELNMNTTSLDNIHEFVEVTVFLWKTENPRIFPGSLRSKVTFVLYLLCVLLLAVGSGFGD